MLPHVNMVHMSGELMNVGLYENHPCLYDTTSKDYRDMVYSDWTRRCQCDSLKHDALVLEHMLFNRSIHTGCGAIKLLYNSDAVDLTLARPV